MEEIFVGRQGQLAQLHAQLDQARRGLSRVVFLEGLPGIGKTALLQRFLQDRSDLCVVQAAGEEFEASLVFGLVEQMFRGLKLPVAQRLATRRADQGGADALAVGAEILEALGQLQRQATVVLAVDDAQWADAASVQALTFALRRLRGDRVLGVIVTRDTVAERLPEGLQRLLASDIGMRLRLDGLCAVEIEALAERMGAGPLPNWAARRLHTHTSGNPLHARALIEELSSESICDHQVPLPAPRSFAMLVLGRLARCSSQVERLVVAVAVLGRPSPLDLAAQLADLDSPLVALEQAIAAQLLGEQHTPAGQLVACRHPLVQAAVYRDLGPARRSSLHSRAAHLVDDELESLRHRVAAVTGADDKLAAEVATSARQQAVTGVWTNAADALTAAARLSSVQAERERYLLDAVDCMVTSGSTVHARALEDTLRAFPTSARQSYTLGRLALVSGTLGRAKALLTDAWRRCDRLAEPPLAAQIAGQLASLYQIRGNGLRSAAWARRALAADRETARAQHVTDVLLLTLGLRGRFEEGLASCASLPGDLDQVGSGPLDGLVAQAVLRLWSGASGRARRELATAVSAFRRRGGPVHFLLVGLVALADAHYRLGAWDEAVAHGQLAVAIAEDAEQRWLLAPLHAVTAFPLICRGAWTQAAAHLRAAASPHPTENMAALAYHATACALLEAARNNPPGVVTAVGPLLHLEYLNGDGDHGILPWRELYVDALIGLGRCDEAEGLLRPLEALTADRDDSAWRTGVGRLRGDLEAARGNPGRAEGAYRAGLDAARTCEHPFDRARLQLAYGRFLRRHGRRAMASTSLEAAQEGLARLGALPYVDRCERELHACGIGHRRRQAASGPALTTQEWAVARLVAAGYSNRETARELVLSVKTVEFHLGNVFSKFGIRSRSQLVVELAKTGESS
jgi:DNA-binding CsgD family transcriptional regulator/tetratricopeptide (TPR) repeat protein